MNAKSFWARLREARAVQGLLVFLGASWLILQLLDIFIDNLGVPAWTMFGAIIILGIGLVIQLSVIWVQALQLARREAPPEQIEIPSSVDDRPAATARGVHRFNWARFALGGIFAFALLFGLAGTYVLFVDVAEGSSPEVAPPSLPEAGPGVAVLPFSVSGTGLDQIGDGMANLLSTNIDGAGGLRAIDTRTVLARWDELVDGRDRADQPTNLAVARATGARYALLGSAVAAGADVRLQVDVYDVETGGMLDRRQVEGRPDSVLALVDLLSVEAIDAIAGRTDADLRAGRLTSLMTASIPAVKEFLDGDAAYRSADFETARGAYERAIEHDSTFALAFYQLANTWGWTDGPGHPGAIENRRRAVELGDRLPERLSLLVEANDELFLGELSAIDKLEDVVARFPDHAEAWYLLGDAYFHLGPRSLASPEDMDRAFGEAVALDPNFAPFHIHLLDLSFPLRDSTLASRRIERYGELAEGSLFERRSELQFDLTYGDPETRRQAGQRLETLPIGVLRSAVSGPLNACCWHAKEPVLEQLRDRGDEDMQGFVRGQLANGAMTHGEVRRALELYEDPAINPVAKACTLGFHSTLEYPIPDAELDRALAIDDLATDDHMEPFCRALHAGRKGRWAEFDQVADDYRAQDDPGSDDRQGPYHGPQLMATALDGYKLWRRGQPRAALPLVEEAFRGGLFGWWLGDIYEQLDRDADAARFYAAHYAFPLAYHRLGRVYERLGESEKAAAAYRVFLNAWENADPELSHLREEAIDGIRRTTDPPGDTSPAGGAAEGQSPSGPRSQG